MTCLISLPDGYCGQPATHTRGASKLPVCDQCREYNLAHDDPAGYQRIGA